MLAESCLNACEASFQRTVGRLNDVLIDALIQADGDESLEERARENFERGLRLAMRARDICVSSCNNS